MPSTDIRGLFDPASTNVFIPTPHNSQSQSTVPSTDTSDVGVPHASSGNEELQSDRALNAQATADPIQGQTDYVSPPGRRHYIAEILANQGVSVAYCSRRLGVSPEEVLRQLDPHSNLTLQQLFDWSEALDVPLPELLPFDAGTSDPIRNRALLLRIMKTARQIQQLSRNTPVEYAAATLVSQLLELVPDFEPIEPWPTVGKSRAAKSDGTSLRRVDSETSRIIENNS